MHEVCITSEVTFCELIDDLNNHDVLSQAPERTTEDSLEKSTDNSRGKDEFVRDITDSPYMSFRRHDNREWTIFNGANVTVTPSREVF